MATVSFDEKVVITNPETVAKMRKDLNDPSPVDLRHNYRYTQEKGKSDRSHVVL